METGRSFIDQNNMRAALFALKNTFIAWHKLCSEEVEKEDSNLRILFGGVSISNKLPQDLQEKLVFFLQNIVAFQIPETLVSAKDSHNKFTIPQENLIEYKAYFNEISIEENLVKLKKEFKDREEKFPTLFDSYIGLGKPGAIRFGEAVQNPDRGNCVEVFMIVDLLNLADDVETRFGNPKEKALRDKIKR